MDIQGLKDKILQLAIQGKLVDQDKNDEPASALLNRIKEERDKLVKEGKIKKQKPLPEITDKEKPFEIPESWEWVRLGEIALVNMGQSPKGDSVNDNEGMEFHQGKVYFGDRYLNKSDKYTTSPNKIAQPGDILLSVRAPVGAINITDREVCIGRGLCAISGLGYKRNDYYFYVILALKKYLIERATGTTFLAVTVSTVNEMLIPLPPLAEQKRIVEKVDELFALIDELDSNKVDLLEVINLTRNQVLQEAIQGKLVEQNPEDEPASVLLERIKEERDKLVKEGKIKKQKPLPEITEEEKPFKLPEGWEWVRFGDIAEYKKGPFGSSITKSMFVPKSENTVKIYEQKNAIQKDVSIGDYYITEEKFRELQSFELNPGDIIVSCAGTIGETFIMPKNMEKGIINQALMKVTLSEYVEKQFYLMYFDYILNSQITNISKGSAIKNIPPLKHLKSITFPLPPLAEQKRIVEKVDMIMDMLDELEKELIINI